MTTDLAIGLVEYCLPEALPAPVDETLEADQFRCVACGVVTWEHDHDERGECPDCAAAHAVRGLSPVLIPSAGPSTRPRLHPSVPTAAVDLAQVLNGPANRPITPARIAQETTP